MSAKRVAIIDYGMGNLHSVASAIARVAPQVQVDVTGDGERIQAADHVIFPGVGAIRDCMAEILRLGVDRKVREALDAGKPVLAICVGMQALMEFSEENNGVKSLGLLPGQVKRFPSGGHKEGDQRLKVPHMGWNQVEQTADHPLWEGIGQNSRFYFVHSYYVEAGDRALVAGRGEYGVPFDAALQHENLFAVQFHPEKSHTDGLQLLKNFVAWDGRP
ncbi:imidazole glycerol phosphate synthase subunit HisH [Gilvimarinus sp. F26214L]|uniref:imidazole glycerol phosphate synthase subunit HisH n=1 Tax=Gilvimarinus sp. DZF01 TaxID=3461371 RepID=UPI004045AFC6